MPNIILFASGKGSNIQAILDYFSDDTSFKPTLIVVNNPEAGAINIAKKHNIAHLVIDRISFKSADFIENIREHNPDLIILAGFLWKLPPALVQTFPDKIINIHPALLPKYGGKGMYGMHVHEAVIAQKESESGITIHYVNENYDEGNQICQAHCKVDKQDTPESLAQKIHQLEHYFFPRTIEFLLQNTRHE